MKITFWREGPANNSSSSHSIIFTNAKLETDEYDEFGWDFFTAADTKSKRNYAMMCLYSSWKRYNSLGWSHANINWEDLERFYRQQFIKWLPTELQTEDWGDYVDHQSIFNFPSYRDVSKGINIDFAGAWINELLRSEYAILGGNDNTNSVHFALSYSEGLTDLISVYNLLQDIDTNTIAVKDEKTDEWILSNTSGLYKFKF